jgi:hypothetical protein
LGHLTGELRVKDPLSAGLVHVKGCPTTSEIENLRRSTAMLPPQAAGLSREEAMRLLAELEEMDQRLRDLRQGLTAALLERTSPDAQG